MRAHWKTLVCTSLDKFAAAVIYASHLAVLYVIEVVAFFTALPPVSYNLERLFLALRHALQRIWFLELELLIARRTISI